MELRLSKKTIEMKKLLAVYSYGAVHDTIFRVRVFTGRLGFWSLLMLKVACEGFETGCAISTLL